MHKAKLFMNGRSQAVRLPKDCRFEGDEVLVKKIDDMLVIIPLKSAWKNFVSSLDAFSPDYMEDRHQTHGTDRREKL